MTEAEWLTSDNPVAMLDGLSGVGTPLWHAVAGVTAGGVPDGFPAGPRKLRAWVGACREEHDLRQPSQLGWPAPVSLDWGLRTAVRTWVEVDDGVLSKADIAALLRDVFGNPFRPVTATQEFKSPCYACLGVGMTEIPNAHSLPCRLCQSCRGKGVFTVHLPAPWLSWNGGAVVEMARVIRDERSFERMPVLADLLEEAGYDNADVLGHCRGLRRCPECGGWLSYFGEEGWWACGHGRWRGTPEPHCRGCWVLDLLLGSD